MHTIPPSERPIAQAYMWTPAVPAGPVPADPSSPRVPNQLGERFAERAIVAQPLGYARVVAYDTIRSFEWKRYGVPERGHL